jgi:serine protease AprX
MTTSRSSASFLLIGALAAVSLAQTPGVDVLRAGDVTRLSVETARGDQVAIRETRHEVMDAVFRTVPGSPARAVTWTELDPGTGATPSFYSLSLDGLSFTEAIETSYEILLRHGQFDPLVAVPEVAPTLRALPASRLWIVQYWTQGIDAYRDVVRALGGDIHLFLANHANVIESGPDAVELLRAQPFVRWVGPYHPAYKLEEALVAEQSGREGAPPLRRVNLLTTRRGPAGHEPVAALLAAMGARLVAASESTHLVTADVTAENTLELASSDAVQWIDRWSPPEDDMNVAREFHGANYLESVAGYTGAGVRVEVLDGGCDTTHPDMQSFLLHGSNNASAHGTCTSGIVVGTGAGNASARGGIPNAFLVIGDYDFLFNRYNHTADLQNDSLAYKCVLQSNSWGNTLTTAYTSISQDMDLILFDFQRFSILQSQSNAGTQSSRPQAWAKNIISVGGVYHFNTLSKADDSWSGGASIGPAVDGRIKPDVASFYDVTLCTDQVGSAGYTTTNYYSSFGGTSGATPITAGHLGLLYQMWADGLFGNSAPGPTVYDDRPNNTAMKALLINTATQWTFSGTAHDLTRTHQGWGHADVKSAYDLRNNLYIVDETDVLTNLGSTTHPVTVAAGAAALKATLVYRDRPGTTSSTLHRINNLNLRVTAPNATVYWGNNGLSAGNWSTPGGSANNVDTVENVFVQSPQSGTWQIEVIAAELNQDSHVETPGVDADYALVVSGVTLGPPPPPVANFSASPTSGFAPLAVSFTNLSTGGPTAWAWDFGDGGTATIQNPSHTYASAGTYTVSLTVTAPGGSDGETKIGYITVDPPPAGTVVYVSFSDVVNVPGVGNVDDEDIVRRDSAGAWSLYFDGSDVGLSGTDLAAFEILPSGQIAMVFDSSSFSVPGLTGGPNGTTVTWHDIVLFTPTSLGPTTAGSFSFYFDGSDVGLTKNAEAIDALAIDASGAIFISTIGNPAIPGLTGLADEDVMRFIPSTLGSATSGAWSWFFDGSDVGFSDTASEELDACALNASGQLRFSTLGDFTAPGASGDAADIGQFSGTFGTTTSGTSSILLDLSALGILAGANVDGLATDGT